MSVCSSDEALESNLSVNCNNNSFVVAAHHHPSACLLICLESFTADLKKELNLCPSARCQQSNAESNKQNANTTEEELDCKQFDFSDIFSESDNNNIESTTKSDNCSNHSIKLTVKDELNFLYDRCVELMHQLSEFANWLHFNTLLPSTSLVKSRTDFLDCKSSATKCIFSIPPIDRQVTCQPQGFVSSDNADCRLFAVSQASLEEQDATLTQLQNEISLILEELPVLALERQMEHNINERMELKNHTDYEKKEFLLLQSESLNDNCLLSFMSGISDACFTLLFDVHNSFLNVVKNVFDTVNQHARFTSSQWEHKGFLKGFEHGIKKKAAVTVDNKQKNEKFESNNNKDDSDAIFLHFSSERRSSRGIALELEASRSFLAVHTEEAIERFSLLRDEGADHNFIISQDFNAKICKLNSRIEELEKFILVLKQPTTTKAAAATDSKNSNSRLCKNNCFFPTNELLQYIVDKRQEEIACSFVFEKELAAAIYSSSYFDQQQQQQQQQQESSLLRKLYLQIDAIQNMLKKSPRDIIAPS